MALIYKLTCSINGKIYVGQTTLSLDDRWKIHLHHTRSRHGAIQNAILKYGVNAFTREVLEECVVELLDSCEIHWISELRSSERNVGYNRTFGGNTKITEDVRVRLSEMRRGSKNPMYGRSPSPETRALISAAHRGRVAPNKGKKSSPETVAKQSEGVKRAWDRRRLEGRASPRFSLRRLPALTERQLEALRYIREAEISGCPIGNQKLATLLGSRHRSMASWFVQTLSRRGFVTPAGGFGGKIRTTNAGIDALQS